ncbi:MAG TPA: ABC transporter permease, partial [Chitinophagaceae bacterium]
MLKNYFKTAFRNLWRNKSFAFINIAGLAVGTAVCIVIFLIVQFELSFDNFHSKKTRIYRILTQQPNADGLHITPGVPFPMPVTMHSDFPGIASSGVFELDNTQIIITGQSSNQIEKKFKEESGTFYVEPSFFEIFEFPLLAGDYKSLKDPNTLLLTKETAERYFGEWQSAIGKTFRINGNSFFGKNDNVYRVTGILA